MSSWCRGFLSLSPQSGERVASEASRARGGAGGGGGGGGAAKLPIQPPLTRPPLAVDLSPQAGRGEKQSQLFNTTHAPPAFCSRAQISMAAGRVAAGMRTR